jgi:5-methylcytosine-specific restriction enzyme subunit McrC
VTVELLPKVERVSQDPSAIRGLLVAMLAKTGELGLKRVGGADLEKQSNHLLDVFIEDFCDQVKAALRAGAIARYSEKSENLHAMRGRLELTNHLRRNAFDHSQLLCRFDERCIDNAYNRALKAVLRLLLQHALSPRTRSIVVSFLHRFDGVRDREVRASDLDALVFDRTMVHWKDVFRRAGWLLSGLFPDARKGYATGSALLFNMERIFEKILGLRVRRECQAIAKHRLAVKLQGPLKNLATSGFQLRPDITIKNENGIVAILDAKWKVLAPGEANSSVSSADAYQVNAYASRYNCNRLALVYPASQDCEPGHVTAFELITQGRPILDIIAIDVRELAFGSGIPTGLEEIILNTLPSELAAVSSAYAETSGRGPWVHPVAEPITADGNLGMSMTCP